MSKDRQSGLLGKTVQKFEDESLETKEFLLEYGSFLSILKYF